MSEQKQSKTPWVEKYRPKTLKEMALPSAKLNRQKVDLAEELKEFVKNFFKKLFNKEFVKGVLLQGQPGIGKTSIVYALANDLNMEVIETNASDTRTKGAIEARLKETSKSKGIMDFITEKKKKLILIDEVDGIYGTKDRGAIPAIMDLIKTTQFPIIMCANEYKSSLSPIYNIIPKYEVHPLSKNKIINIVENIIEKENITNISKEETDLIIEKNGGDLRGVINDLQAISRVSVKKGEDNKDMIYSLHRDTTEEIFGLLRDLFQKVSSLNEARRLTDKSDVDYNFLYKWVNENIPSFIYSKKELATAYERLSMADVIFGRIRKNMEWSLLPYFFDLFAGGVALAARSGGSKGYRPIHFPRYSSSYFMSLNNAEKGLIEKIQEHYPISQNEAFRDLIPFLKHLTSTSRRKLKEISEFLELASVEKKLLK